ncbi:HDOD domain-containing protein [Anaeromyxobacter paludicola]|uniref:HDOD domain-containing protein n=1 Tax=Anaeromyxobacter paludicola TaxID=2918171 RepID=A0ABM7XBK7_9BACT|nr:HDOD domain-containing protein [Anaeromyxobacter paludicola]BDG09207.1 hypothetical protein AMPC_23200 [Anaeromyxobacter paludicola]
MNDTAREPGFDPVQLTVRLMRLLTSPVYRPPMLPGVAIEIMQLSQTPGVNFDQVVAILERDPLLAARVLSISQSALYTSRSPITSLKQAVVRLGMGTLRDLVLEAALNMRVFRVPGFEAPMQRLAHHSTATAYLARAICSRTAIPAEYAFLCGLLHDVGIAAALLALAEDRDNPRVPFDVAAPVLHGVHEEASGLVTRLWNLPAEIQKVVSNHHRPRVDGKPHPVVAAVLVAGNLAYELGLGVVPCPPRVLGPPPSAPLPVQLDVSDPDVVAEAQELLRLDDAALNAVCGEAVGLFEQLGVPLPAPRGAPGLAVAR